MSFTSTTWQVYQKQMLPHRVSRTHGLYVAYMSQPVWLNYTWFASIEQNVFQNENMLPVSHRFIFFLHFSVLLPNLCKHTGQLTKHNKLDTKVHLGFILWSFNMSNAYLSFRIYNICAAILGTCASRPLKCFVHHLWDAVKTLLKLARLRGNTYFFRKEEMLSTYMMDTIILYIYQTPNEILILSLNLLYKGKHL